MNQDRIQPVESGSTSYSSGAGVSFNTNNEDKATISISLPTSILKDQKHFQSVIETINNVLIQSPDESTVAPMDPGADDSSVNISSQRNVSSAGKVTSVPVSVLAFVLSSAPSSVLASVPTSVPVSAPFSAP